MLGAPANFSGPTIAPPGRLILFTLWMRRGAFPVSASRRVHGQGNRETFIKPDAFRAIRPAVEVPPLFPGWWHCILFDIQTVSHSEFDPGSFVYTRKYFAVLIRGGVIQEFGRADF